MTILPSDSHTMLKEMNLRRSIHGHGMKVYASVAVSFRFDFMTITQSRLLEQCGVLHIAELLSVGGVIVSKIKPIVGAVWCVTYRDP